MRFLKATACGLAMTALLACQPGGGADTASLEAEIKTPPHVSVLITDGERGDWTLQITRDPAYDAFAFVRAGADWRSTEWVSQTLGVSMERIDGMDAIVFAPNAAEVATFAFRPYSGEVQATYTPRIPFSDGADAIFLGAFNMIPLTDRAAVAALMGEASNHTDEGRDVPLSLITDRPILYAGERHTGRLDVKAHQGLYAYLGEATITEGESFKGVIDPGMPDFITKGLDEDLVRVFTALDKRFGEPLDQTASLLVAFRGFDEPGFSLRGGVLPGNMMSFEISGDVLKTENPRIQPYLQRFFAHEATHLYQGDTRYEHKRHAWIGEGAAETMSLQIAMDLGLADAAVQLEQYAENYAFCDEALKGRTLEDAIRRGNEGNYDCGDLLALIADAAIGEHSLADLWTAMASRTDGDGYTAEHHFEAMLELGADPTLVERMRRFTSETVDDPLGELRAMGDAVGIEANFEDGALVAFSVPATAR